MADLRERLNNRATHYGNSVAEIKVDDAMNEFAAWLRDKAESVLANWPDSTDLPVANALHSLADEIDPPKGGKT